MSHPGPKAAPLARLRKTISRYAKDGWQRAIFAQPGATDESARVLERSSVDDGVEALADAAVDAALAGLVKQTLVIDERSRVRIDARYGRGKLQQLDDATLTKMMGGKDRPLRPDRSAELLRVIGLMNPDGSISAKHAKKYKQINHFVELCRPVWERIERRRTITPAEPLSIVDIGSGNAYLTLVMAESLRLSDRPARIHGVDRRADLVERSRTRADALGLASVTFSCQSIDEVDLVALGLERPDLVVALHACDTATDDALALAIEAAAPAILAAPCCQAELARQLELATASAAAVTPSLLEQALYRREYAAVLTDALRVDVLRALGYRVDVVEFVGGEHTPKNMLIRAHLEGASPRRDPSALTAVRARCESLGLQPHLLARLSASG